MGRALGRLIRRQDFLRIAGSRRKWVGPGFILQAARTPEPDASALPDSEATSPDTRPSRLGFTASKKVGNAVTRNRARRRLRHAAREILAPYSVDGHDYVLIARAATPGVEYAALKADLLAALRRLGLYRADAGSES